jgi:hypothetical protein
VYTPCSKEQNVLEQHRTTEELYELFFSGVAATEAERVAIVDALILETEVETLAGKIADTAREMNVELRDGEAHTMAHDIIERKRVDVEALRTECVRCAMGENRSVFFLEEYQTN